MKIFRSCFCQFHHFYCQITYWKYIYTHTMYILYKDIQLSLVKGLHTKLSSFEPFLFSTRCVRLFLKNRHIKIQNVFDKWQSFCLILFKQTVENLNISKRCQTYFDVINIGFRNVKFFEFSKENWSWTPCSY